MALKEIKPEELNVSPFTTFSKDWVLITAEKEGKVNTMTASWGGLGFIWNKNVVTVYIRPQRYTKEFVDANTRFSVSVLPEEYRKQLSYLGTASGRDEDKIVKAGLTVSYYDGVPSFEEAKLVFNCRKLFKEAMAPENFLEEEPKEKWYAANDYHVIYIGEIEKVLEK